MSFSYNLFPVAEIKKLHGGVEHFESFPILGEAQIDYNEEESRYPNLTELPKAISTDGMQIIEENIRETENGIICKSYQVIDKEFSNPNDLTIIYEDTDDENPRITSIFGVKSELEFMIKIASKLSKDFGSMALSSPYEVVHVSKKHDYLGNLKKIKTSTNSR